MTGLLAATKSVLATLVGVAVLGVGLTVASAPSGLDSEQQGAVERETPAPPAGQAAPRPPATVTVTGTVVDPDGRPVGGASVRTAEPADGGAPAVREVATTGPDGKFTARLDPLPSGLPDTRQLVAVKAGYGPDWITLAGGAGGEVTLRLGPDVPVKGRVTDLEGRPVPNALVTVIGIRTTASGDLGPVWEGWRRDAGVALERADKQLHSPVAVAGLPASVRADRDGRFEIAGIGRDRIATVMIGADGIATTTCRITTDPRFDPKRVAPAPGEGPGRVDHEVHGASFTFVGRPTQPVTGTVTDARTGEPVAGVQVLGGTDVSGDNRAGDRTDAKGRFVLKGLAKAAAFDLAVVPAKGQPYFPVTLVVRGRPGLEEVTAEVKLSRGVVLKGRVVERGTGRPVAGAGVRYEALAGNSHYAALLKGGATTSPGTAWPTDRDGRFQFVVLPGAGIVAAQSAPGGPHYTQVRAAAAHRPLLFQAGEAYPGQTFPTARGDDLFSLFGQSGYAIIDPKAGDDSVSTDLVFDAGRSVSGAVLDAAGRPAEGVTAYGLAACNDVPRTLTDGRFEVAALESDRPRTVLFVDHPRKLAAAVELTGDEKVATARLQPWGAVSGRLVDAGGRPVAGATVVAEVKDAAKYAAVAAALRDATAVTDADGKFALPVPAGAQEYVLSFRRNNRALDTGARGARRGLVVRPGDTTEAGQSAVGAD